MDFADAQLDVHAGHSRSIVDFVFGLDTHRSRSRSRSRPRSRYLWQCEASADWQVVDGAVVVVVIVVVIVVVVVVVVVIVIVIVIVVSVCFGVVVTLRFDPGLLKTTDRGKELIFSVRKVL
jgi:Flp pilus assembly protein TadB